MKFELEEFHRDIPNEELLSDMRNVATRLNSDYLTTRQQNEFGKYTMQTIILRFGTWINALEKAGLKIIKKRNISNEELFRNLERVWTKLGRQPKTRDMLEKISSYGFSPYMRVFGSWRNALEKFVTYINNEANISSEEAIKNVEVEPITRHKTSRTINWRLRFIVMRRDNFKCKSCGRSPATDLSIVLHVDHIKAWANGGETIFKNLQTLCSKCNIGKSDLK